MARVAFILLALTTAALAAVSVASHYGASPALYTSWWMVTLWALTAAATLVTLAQRRRMRGRLVMTALHVSFAVILCGAAVSHFCGSTGFVHLRVGEAPAATYTDDDGSRRPLPAGLSLRSFIVETYPGTEAPRDYVSVIAVEGIGDLTVSMNAPASAGGYRLLQGTYDNDARGVTLCVSHDPWGRGISYAGYALLIVSFIAYFFTRHSTWRRSLAALRAAAAVAALMSAGAMSAATLSGDALDRLCGTAVYYNDRVAPLSTVARDFTTTVTGGSDSYDGHTAEEVMAGFLFDFGHWRSVPLIRIKNSGLRGILGAAHVSYETFYAATADGRIDIDDPAVVQRYGADIQRFEAVNMLVSGALLRVFAVADGQGGVRWYAPTDRLQADIDNDRWMFIRKFWGLYNEQVIRGDESAQADLLAALGCYQRAEASGAVPPLWRLSLERTYNRLGDMMPVALTAVVAGLVMMGALVMRPQVSRRRRLIGLTLNVALLLWLSVIAAMRWMVGGHVPMSNGYETMVVMAWCIALVACVASRSAVMQALCTLGAGLSLAVAAMSGSGSAVGGLMPVLSSPLLSIHVLCVMGAYALLLTIALTGVLALIRSDAALRLASLSRVMLYPAIMLLACGIFIGAVWADMSWGRYWGWDPKEVWALITLLVYTPAAHPGLLPSLARPRRYHLYVTVAFGTVLVTYFGVNFVLGGLHSYA